MRTFLESGGGFVPSPRKNAFRQQQAGSRQQPRVQKSAEDVEAELAAARARWQGVPPLVAAREMVAEANLALELLGRVSAAIAGMQEEQLTEFVNSGELSRQLVELAAN